MAGEITRAEQVEVIRAARVECERTKAAMDKARELANKAEADYDAACERLDAARHKLLETL